MSQVTVVEVPQWQGSGSATAERLVEGAGFLAAMVPDAVRHRIEVGEGDTPATLAATAGKARTVIGDAREGFVVTVGGDCGVELAPVSAAIDRYGERLALVWFDAHGDLNTPASSPSGAFHGMILRALTGEGHDELVPSRAISPGRVVLAGARDLDPGERDFIAANALTHVTVADLSDPAVLVDAVAATGATAIYVHIDLDVLDPGVFASVGSPAPEGLQADHLLKLVTALTERFEPAGLGITEYEPGRLEDQVLLAPLVAALVASASRS